MSFFSYRYFICPHLNHLLITQFVLIKLHQPRYTFDSSVSFNWYVVGCRNGGITALVSLTELQRYGKKILKRYAPKYKERTSRMPITPDRNSIQYEQASSFSLPFPFHLCSFSLLRIYHDNACFLSLLQSWAFTPYS